MELTVQLLKKSYINIKILPYASNDMLVVFYNMSIKITPSEKWINIKKTIDNCLEMYDCTICYEKLEHFIFPCNKCHKSICAKCAIKLSNGYKEYICPFCRENVPFSTYDEFATFSKQYARRKIKYLWKGF